MPSAMDYGYGGIYRDARDASQRQDQIAEAMRTRRANELLAQQRLQMQQQRYLEQGRVSQLKEQAQGALDTEANQLANFQNPPAAEAVTPPGGDPAWTRRATVMRDRYYQAHPNEQPGPPVPYEGGKALMSRSRPVTAPSGAQDAIAARMATSRDFTERQRLQKELDGIRKNISLFVPNPDQITGLASYTPESTEWGSTTPKAYGPDGYMLDVAYGPNTPQQTLNLQGKFKDKGPVQSMSQLADLYNQLGQKKQRLKELGGMLPANPIQDNLLPAAGDLPVFSNPEEAKTAPPGTLFKTPDGRTLRVK